MQMLQQWLRLKWPHEWTCAAPSRAGNYKHPY